MDQNNILHCFDQLLDTIFDQLSLTVKNRWTHNEMFELYNFI